MTPDPPAALDECDCHTWYDTAVIGDWTHAIRGGRASHPKTCSAIVATENIWERSKLPHDELTARIIASGRRITCEYALAAWTLADGSTDLSDGLHRWAVAIELGISRVPVGMRHESPSPAWAWGMTDDNGVV